MATIYMNKIVQRLYEAPTEQLLKTMAQDRAQDTFDQAVRELKDEFNDHPVTQELDRGIGSPNISQTLRGGDAPENLYSFIGFEAGTDPTKPIRDRLDPAHPDGPKLRLRGKERRGTSIRYQFVVDGPDTEAIWEETPMPWAPGLSWARKIEGKIPGLGAFLARFMGEPSRSGGGIQAKGPDGEVRQLRNAEYVRPDGGYLQTMFRRFLNRVRRPLR